MAGQPLLAQRGESGDLVLERCVRGPAAVQVIQVDGGLKLLQALAEHFGVPAAYLTDTDAKLIAGVNEQLDLLADLMPMAARRLGDTSSLSVLARTWTRSSGGWRGSATAR